MLLKMREGIVLIHVSIPLSLRQTLSLLDVHTLHFPLQGL